jgi:phosphate uptake regulator
MKRKVIQLAGRTLVISLPASWVRKYDVKKADELDVVEHYDSLTVQRQGGIYIPREILIDAKGFSEDILKSSLSVAHKSGYDIVELLVENRNQVRAIRRRTSELVGFEVVEQSDSRVLVKSIAGDNKEELGPLVRRSFLVTIALADETLAALRVGDAAALEDALVHEVVNNRLTNYCHRLLNRHSHGPHSTYTYIVLWLLESLADDYKSLINYVVGAGITLPADVLDLFELINAHVRKFYEFYFQDRLDLLDGLRRENRQLRYECQKVSTRSTAVLHLFVMVNRIYDALGSTTGKKFLEVHKGF